MLRYLPSASHLEQQLTRWLHEERFRLARGRGGVCLPPPHALACFAADPLKAGPKGPWP